MTWNASAVFDALINKLHIALGCAAQGLILVYHFKTGHDIGPGVTSTMYAYYGFLLGHAGVYQRWPDKDEDKN
jgi:hypothetical protein